MDSRQAVWRTDMVREPYKRAIDIVGSSLLLLFFLPFFGVVALAIRASDGGGIFYAHTRVGRDGRTFDCLKFRSMRQDAAERLDEILKSDAEARRTWENQRKLPEDPRILPGVGHVLRKSSLDELPQLINVLRGEMSLVGPRPVMHDELSYYGPQVDWYFSVRPGLTGPWQISGRSDTSYEERVTLDVDYARNWSVGKDLVILLRTPSAVLFGGGAY